MTQLPERVIVLSQVQQMLAQMTPAQVAQLRQQAQLQQQRLQQQQQGVTQGQPNSVPAAGQPQYAQPGQVQPWYPYFVFFGSVASGCRFCEHY